MCEVLFRIKFADRYSVMVCLGTMSDKLNVIKQMPISWTDACHHDNTNVYIGKLLNITIMS